jgi:4-amino-4-deoxy-L-arabinose transferase-like glycosyltransferase
LPSKEGSKESARASAAGPGLSVLPPLLVALAVAVRLVWVLRVPTRPVGDFSLYLESAAHLLAHGAFDPQFIYMPGYVVLLAAVQALGGGLLAAKLLGVAFAGLAAGAIYGIAARVFDRAAAIGATLLYAIWPAGIAVSSVTGTDMPAAALVVAAIYFLMRWGPQRPWLAAVAFGVVLGLAAYVRAVAVPLAVLALGYWLALKTPVRAALTRTALGCGVAFLVLLPWGIRNQVRYGELFITDSHGGHTALVGSNPNTDGAYSRSLNQMFGKGTGFRLFAEPHRESDRAAYDLARSWAAFEPLFALGLVATKADRLLTHERGLLYWPLYRESVLQDAQRRWFDQRRSGVEAVTDRFWYVLVAAAALGVVVSFSRRLWPALSLLPYPLALVALYATFFSEPRYHLAIAVFMFPFAGMAIRWVAQGARGLAERSMNVRGRRRLLREAAWGTVILIAVFVGWPALVRAGATLRDRHRWAVSVCTLEGKSQLCNWRRSAPPLANGGVSPVRGAWNAVGLRLTAPVVATQTALDLEPGRYSFRAQVDVPGGKTEHAADLALRVNGVSVASLRVTGGPAEAAKVLEASAEHPGGPVVLELRATAQGAADEGVAIWVTDLKIVRSP